MNSLPGQRRISGVVGRAAGREWLLITALTSTMVLLVLDSSIVGVKLQSMTHGLYLVVGRSRDRQRPRIHLVQQHRGSADHRSERGWPDVVDEGLAVVVGESALAVAVSLCAAAGVFVRRACSVARVGLGWLDSTRWRVAGGWWGEPESA